MPARRALARLPPPYPLPQASCQIPGTRSWQPWEFPSAKLTQPVTAPPRGYDKLAQPVDAGRVTRT